MRAQYLILLLCLVALQQPILSEQLTNGTISGIVKESGTEEPIAGATITVSMVSLTGSSFSNRVPPIASQATGAQAITDSQGRFRMTGLAAGSYQLFVVHETHVPKGYSTHDAAQAVGPIVEVVAGETFPDVSVIMVRTASITGRVASLSGEPLVGLDVQLLSPAYDVDAGRPLLRSVKTTKTDDRGRYRLYGVAPGSYYVSSSSATITPLSNISRDIGNAGLKRYARTFFPSVSDLSRATLLKIAAGEESQGIDLVMPELHTYRVKGRVVDARSGATPPNPTNTFTVSVVPRDLFLTMLVGGSRITLDSRAQFEFDIPPGQYWITATLASTQTGARIPTFSSLGLSPNLTEEDALVQAQRLMRELSASGTMQLGTGVAMIDVNDSDIDVVLTIRSAISITGSLTLDGQDLSRLPGRNRIRIALASPKVGLTSVIQVLPPVPVNQDGSFTLSVVPWDGPYRLVVEEVPANLFLKEAHIGTLDLLAQPLRISSPVSDPLEITLSSASSQIVGRVIGDDQESSSNVLVALIPNRGERTDLYRVLLPDSKGSFTFAGIAPGQYKLFAQKNMAPVAFFDPDYVRRNEDKAVPITVVESSKLTVEIPVTGDAP